MQIQNAGIAAGVVSEEFEDGVAYVGQSWLRRRPVESFFPLSRGQSPVCTKNSDSDVVVMQSTEESM